eukprot:199489_1
MQTMATAIQVIQPNDGFKLLAPLSTFSQSNGNQFSIMSWNILIKTDTNHNGPPEYSKWDHRLSKIKETILSIGSDIVCLQECHSPSFMDDFAVFFQTNGYEFKLNAKEPDSNDNAKYSEMATAILWKDNKFRYKYHDFRSKATILLLEIISSNDENKSNTEETKPQTNRKTKPPNALQIYLSEKNDKSWHSLPLEEKQTYIERARGLSKEWKLTTQKQREERTKAMQSYVFITNVHLEAHGRNVMKEKQANKKEMRFNQIKHSIERITNYTKNQLRVQALESIQCVFCGDFNAERGSEVDRMLTTKSNGNALIHELDLKNAYLGNIKDSEKKKCIVSHWISNRLIDHFYYTFNNLKCVRCIDTVHDGVVKGMKYPNKDIVSDHLPIAAMFEMKRDAMQKYSGKKRTFAMMDEKGDAEDKCSSNKKQKVAL